MEIMLLTEKEVVKIHDEILITEPGAKGCNGDKLAGALSRIESAIHYDKLDDIFEVAALYIEAIAMGHCFVDCNKRTALSSAITFLEFHDIIIRSEEKLADLVEDLVKKEISRSDVATVLRHITLP